MAKKTVTKGLSDYRACMGKELKGKLKGMTREGIKKAFKKAANLCSHRGK